MLRKTYVAVADLRLMYQAWRIEETASRQVYYLYALLVAERYYHSFYNGHRIGIVVVAFVVAVVAVVAALAASEQQDSYSDSLHDTGLNLHAGSRTDHSLNRIVDCDRMQPADTHHSLDRTGHNQQLAGHTDSGCIRCIDSLAFAGVIDIAVLDNALDKGLDDRYMPLCFAVALRRNFTA